MSVFNKLSILLDKFTTNIADAFKGVIQDVTDAALWSLLLDSINEGDPVGAIRALGLSKAAMRPIEQQIETAFEQGGLFAVEAQFPKWVDTPVGPTIFRFDVRDSRAEAWLREESSQLVTRIEEDVRVVVQKTISEGVMHGENPRAIALDIIGRIDPATQRRAGGLVGLTSQMEGFVANARKELQNLDENYFTRVRRDKRFDSVVAKAIAADKPLPVDSIQKIIGRYSDSLLKLRGDNIGRTEALAALNRSDWEAWKQAVDKGAVEQSAIERTWDDAGDNRVRDDHIALNGQKRGLDEPFIVPSTGEQLMYPGDGSLGAGADQIINCRCHIITRAKFFKKVT